MCPWFSIFFEWAFVSRVNRRMPIRIVRFCRSTKLVLMCCRSGLPRNVAALALSLRRTSPSERGAEEPRRELLVPHSRPLGLGHLAPGHSDDLVENPPADVLDRLGAVQDRAGVEVHVVDHVL